MQKSLIVHWPELGHTWSLFQAALCPAKNWDSVPVELGSPALVPLMLGPLTLGPSGAAWGG